MQRNAMLAKGSSGQFLGKSGVAALHNLDENCSDGPFRNRGNNEKGYILLEILLALALIASLSPLILQGYHSLYHSQTKLVNHCLTNSEQRYIQSTLRYELHHTKLLSVSESNLNALGIDGQYVQIAFVGNKLKLKRGSGNFVDLNQQSQIQNGRISLPKAKLIQIQFTIQSQNQESPKRHEIWIETQ